MMSTSTTGRRANNDDQFEMRSTRWKNPTDHTQKVVLFDSTNRKIVVTWAPGETKELPSEYDRAIHMVDCGNDDCHNGGGKRGGGWFCTKGHSGNVQGGLAPLLVRVGAEDTVDPALTAHLPAASFSATGGEKKK